MGCMVISDGRPVLCSANAPSWVGRGWRRRWCQSSDRSQGLVANRETRDPEESGGDPEGCIIRMRQENTTATWHVDETVSIVSTILDSQTRKVMWGHNVISKGWKIVNWNVTCRTVRERKNKHAKYRGCHCWRSAFCARNREWGP
jgi:hypothetical protein